MKALACPALAISLAGCGLPLTVHKVGEPHLTPAQGIRYQLREPKLVPEVGASGNDPDFLPDQMTLGKLDLRLAQSMEDVGFVYEVRPAGRTFSDTEAAVTLGESCVLKGFQAGETDQLGPTLITIASIAVSAAAGVGTTAETKKAFKDELKGLIEYIALQKERQQRLARLKLQIKEYRKGAASAPLAVLVNMRLNTVEALLTEKTRLEQEIKNSWFRLSDKQCHVYVNGKSVFKSTTATTAWFRVDLGEAPKSPKAAPAPAGSESRKE